MRKNAGDKTAAKATSPQNFISHPTRTYAIRRSVNHSGTITLRTMNRSVAFANAGRRIRRDGMT